MTGRSGEEEAALSPDELRMLESLTEVRGYSPRAQVAEPAQPPVGRASASPGAGPLDGPQADGESDETEPSPAD
ncbi:hypothetical protein [Streptomyces tsukubensis]|uniref:Uncharacterized protein n=1 Tax=Streptomyces tsukubensis TaxID=83656 RepID=A0A1V4A9T9_9ACTN|nr:hypothetical protein [Streptomyces tsukubensis]OON79615.1 hypothetical protein B1H18_13630 [Streptomyces tsukubensis]QFR95799.1 hypothetical protein GBW32_25655 [Streptomyces tsukubensis]